LVKKARKASLWPIARKGKDVKAFVYAQFSGERYRWLLQAQ